MRTSSRNKDQLASRRPTFDDMQKCFIVFVRADFSKTELTPAQILKQFWQNYEDVELFRNELRHHPSYICIFVQFLDTFQVPRKTHAKAQTLYSLVSLHIKVKNTTMLFQYYLLVSGCSSVYSQLCQTKILITIQTGEK